MGRTAKENLLVLTSFLCACAAQQASAQAALEEIVVTATRRAENIQDIPVAVTAVTPTQLERQGVSDIGKLGNVSASFSLQSSQSESQGTSIRLRGVGTAGNNIGLESAVGVFIDGVYQSRPGVALGELVDLEAIEVLRGPQGTLFGRNTTAGALVIRSKKPEFDNVNGFINSSVGNFSAFGLQGGVNIPVNDGLAFRLTAAHRQRDGFIQTTHAGGGDSHDRDRFMTRAQMLWEPSEVLSIRIVADHQDSDERCCAGVTLSASPLLDDVTRDRLFPALGFDDSLKDRKFNSSVFENSTEQTGVSTEINWEFGETTLTYIGSYRDFRGDLRQDEFNNSLQYSVAGATFPEREPASFDEIKTITHELRLQGEAFDGRLDWMIGAYYSDEQIEEIISLGLGPDYASSVSAANFGNSSVLDLVTAGGNFFANGGNNPATFVPVGSEGAFATNRYTQDAGSSSLFTHLIFSATEQLDLTIGVRYVDDQKRGVYEQLAASNNSCLAGLSLAGALAQDSAGVSAALAPFGASVQGLLTNPGAVNAGAFLNCFPFAAPALGVGFLPREYDQRFDDEELIYTLQAGYNIDALGLLYAGFTHGYKAGGFNLDATAAASGANPEFVSEVIDSFEVGLKTTLLDGRVRANAALFYAELEDFQVVEFTGTQFQTFNVDDVKSQGVELELQASFTDAVSGDFAVTYTDAGYGNNCDRDGAIRPALGLCDAPLTNAPEWVSVMGITFESLLGSTDWTLRANVGLRYDSERRTSTRPRIVEAGRVIRDSVHDYQDSSAKANMRVGFSHPDERFSIEFWAVNITDKITRNITFNTPLQGSSRSAFIADPRTYGATARFQF